jgi:multicomponent Na+:H+ antiporter subunit D
MIPLYLLILGPIIFGGASYVFFPHASRKLVPVFQFLMVAAASNNFFYIKQHRFYIESLGGWNVIAGITLRMDLMAAVMVLMTTVLFVLMFVFNLKKSYMNPLFMLLFLALEGLIIGILVSNDFFNIFVMVEVSTVLVSILIMFKKDSQSIYDGMVYLMLNVVAMTFFLFGVGMLYRVFGILDFTEIQQRMVLVEDSRSLILSYTMIMTAISLKTALMPLFSWLPKAHGTPSAPSIVSAILSGLYVKIGLYLFIRIQNIFRLHINTSDFFLMMGFLTAIIGFILAISQKDIKLILAYHTISQIGLIMIGLNMGEPQAYWGGIYHIINHAFFKSTLFLTAGTIIGEYGTRDIYKIRGVFKRMPVISIAAIMAVLGITGAPFFNGSISKYWISYGAKGSFAQFGLLVVNLGTIVSFVKYSLIFFGKDRKGRANIDVYSKVVVMIMGTACLIGGIFGKQLISFLFDQQLMVDPYSYFEKGLIFFITILIGILLYFGWISKSKLIVKVRQMELSFNNMCVAIVTFFSILLAYLSFVNG